MHVSSAFIGRIPLAILFLWNPKGENFDQIHSLESNNVCYGIFYSIFYSIPLFILLLTFTTNVYEQINSDRLSTCVLY